MDQIVIINNHEYLGKLHPPKYKKKLSQNRRSPQTEIMKNSKSEEKLHNKIVADKSKDNIVAEDHNPRFTFNLRKDSKATDISDNSIKEKYDKVYDNYVGSVSAAPGFKNRSAGVKAIMNLNQAQYSFNYPQIKEPMPKVVTYNQNGSKKKAAFPTKTPKIKKMKNLKKAGPNIIKKSDMMKYFTPQKETYKI